MITHGNNDITKAFLGSTEVKKICLGSEQVWPSGEITPYTLYMWLDGNDAPVSSKWVDKIGGIQWSITGATHEDGYYEFLNPSSGVGTKYLSLANGGSAINLGVHWKIIADVEISDATQSGYVLDLCSFGTTSTNYKGLGFIFNLTYGAYSNVKRSGNTGAGQNNASDVSFSLDNTWNRMTLVWECIAGETSGYSIVNSYIGDMLCRYTNEFLDTEWTGFRQNTSPYTTVYIGRGALNSSSYKSPLRFRLHDLKIYKTNA